MVALVTPAALVANGELPSARPSAMKETDPAPLGGKDVVVEVDETFIGPQGYEFVNGKGWMQKRGGGDKHKVVTLVERNGRARSIKVERLTAADMRAVVFGNASTDSTLMTDEANYDRNIGKT